MPCRLSGLIRHRSVVSAIVCCIFVFGCTKIVFISEEVTGSTFDKFKRQASFPYTMDEVRLGDLKGAIAAVELEQPIDALLNTLPPPDLKYRNSYDTGVFIGETWMYILDLDNPEALPEAASLQLCFNEEKKLYWIHPVGTTDFEERGSMFERELP